ncbi:MAG: hypothetical protein ACKERG_01290 [Candidatus Hodgkinia cicadicola]
MSSVCKTAIKISKTEEVKKLIEGELVWGTIKYKNDSFMLVNVGFKTEAKVWNVGTWNYKRFEIGQPIQVYIECLDSTTGEVLASRRQLDIDEAWAAALLAQASAAWVKGTIIGCVTEGFAVSVFGLPALLPFGLTDRRFWWELADSSTTSVKLLEVDKSRNYILLVKRVDEGSERIDEDDDDGELQVGDEVWGVIMKVDERCVSIDLGWCRGELILSSVTWYDAMMFVNSAVAGSTVVTLYGGMMEVKREDGEDGAGENGESKCGGAEGSEGGGEVEAVGERRWVQEGEMREVRDVRVMSLVEEEITGDEEMAEEWGDGAETAEAGKLSGEGEKNERSEEEVEEVAVLFLEKSEVEDEEDEEDEEKEEKEGILYGVVEEVTKQTATLRMSLSLVQSVETAAFKVDVGKTQAVQPTLEHLPPNYGDIVKILPICLSLADRQIKLDVDVEGAQYLKFFEANAEFTIEGLICGIESNYAIVALSEDVFGKLEISELLEGGSETVQGKGWEGCAVTVEICDFCPETNTIYLNVADDECTRAALVEVAACPS